MKDSNQKRLSQKKLELNLIRTKGRTLSNSIINTNNNNNNQFYVSLAQEMKTLVSANPKRNSNTHHLNQKLYLHSKVQTSKKKSKQKQKIKTKNKNLNEIIKTIYKNFNKKYSIDPNYYNIKVINEIISNDSSHVVAEFKDYLITGDYNEFIHKYFKLSQSKFLLNQIFEYYALSSVIYPNYIILPENKYIYKNIQKKQKIIDDQQEIEENKEINDLNKQILNGDVNESKGTILTSKVIESILNQTDTSQNKKFFDVSEQSVAEELKITKIVQAIDKVDKNIDISVNKHIKNSILKINKAIKIHKKPKLNLNSKSKTSHNVYNKKIISTIENEVAINKKKNSKNKEIIKKNINQKITSRNKFNSILITNNGTISNTMNDFYTYNLETNANSNSNNTNCKKEFFKTINTKFTKRFLSKLNYEKENETENSVSKKQTATKRNNKTSVKKYLVNILFNEKNSNNQNHNVDLKTARLIEKSNLQKDRLITKRELSHNSANNKNKNLKVSATHISHKVHNLKQISGMNKTSNKESGHNINNKNNNISKNKTSSIENNNNNFNNSYSSKNNKYLFNKRKIKSRNNTGLSDISPNLLTELKDLNTCYNLNNTNTNTNTISDTYTVNKAINNTINNNILNNNSVINNNKTIRIGNHKMNSILTIDNSAFNKTPRTFYNITDTNINVKNIGNKKLLYRKVIGNNYSNKNAHKKNSSKNFLMNENNVPLSARDNREKKAIQEMYGEKIENGNKNKLQFNKNEIPSNITRKKLTNKYSPISFNNNTDQNDKNKIEEKRTNNNDYEFNLMNKTEENELYKPKISTLLNNLNLNQIISKIKTFNSTSNYEEKNQINNNRISNPTLNTRIKFNDINYNSRTIDTDINNKIPFKKSKKTSELIGNYKENYYNVKINIDDDNNKINGEYNPKLFQKHSKIKSTQLSSTADLNINFNNYNTNVFVNKNDAINENELYNGNKIAKVKNGAKKNMLPLHIKGFDKLIIKKDNKRQTFKPITYRDRIKSNNKFSNTIDDCDQA